MKSLLPALLLGCAAGPAFSQSLTAVRLVEGLTNPSDVAFAPGDDERMFVIERKKGIRVVRDGAVQPGFFLHLAPELSGPTKGLLGMAFHPLYETNGLFYVDFADTNQDCHVLEYQVSANPDEADEGTRRQILGPVPIPSTIHSWNCLRFGPDGMLYVSTGDGHHSATAEGNPSQDLSTLHGKMLRIDVDLPPPHIPPDNPFVGVPGAREEIWFLGLRQPWRFSFDPVTGDMFLGDVGPNNWEELNFISRGGEGGENLGWQCVVGIGHCTGVEGCDCENPDFTRPIHDYLQSDSLCCIIAGDIYRGSALPAEYGKYFFADHCGGNIWSLVESGGLVAELVDRTAEIAPQDGSSIDSIVSFGVDGAGELYIVDQNGGEVFRLESGDCLAETYCETSPNSAGDGARISRLGTASVTGDSFRLTVSEAPRQQPLMFFYGPSQTQLPFGDGFLCVNGGVTRLQPALVTDDEGEGAHQIQFLSHPELGGLITPGSTWNFQAWFRDPEFRAAGFNLSDGLRVVFCP